MPKILVVDDDLILARLISDVIRYFGHEVETVGSAEDAETVLEEDTHIDLLLTDIGFKRGIDGFELARRARLRRPDLPILYISGDARRTSAEIGDAKAPILQKPVPPDELEQAISAALSR